MNLITPHTYEIRDRIAVITLNGPPGNFLKDPEFIPVDALKTLLIKEEVKGVVVTGAGKHFSGGASLEDLFAQANDAALLEEKMNSGKRLLEFIDVLEIPVIAAIKGICFGGGLEISLACDMRFCNSGALFAFPESNHNMMPGLAGSYRLSHRIGFPDSLKMILGGDMVNAEEALLMKLVDRIVHDSDPAEAAICFLTRITEGRSIPVINSILRAIRNAYVLTQEEALMEETRMFCELVAAESRRRQREEL